MTRSSTLNSHNWVKHAAGDDDRIEACFSGLAYAPHRHDTYTLAVTTQGVQSFNYRGCLRHSLPGQVLVLHPDELHDGLAGTDQPFGYRALNIDPVKVQDILQGASLPFLANAITHDPQMLTIAQSLLNELDRQLTTLEYQDALYDFAHRLQTLSGVNTRHTPINFQAMQVAREFIDHSLNQEITLDKLAAITGYSKWQLSRDFRALFGTSPHRYLILRRLQWAKRLMLAGHSLASVAQVCHFSDQAHFTRHFKKTVGITPKQWLSLAK